MVVGCFAPDFEYFIRLAPRGGLGHTLPGLFILDLPLGLIVLWLFHAYAKEPLRAWLPQRVRERTPAGLDISSILSPVRLLLTAASILVGAATHILWDSFTHPAYWPYRHWALLSCKLNAPLVGRVPYFKLFQHGSTVLGMVLLALWFAGWYRKAMPQSESDPQQENGRAVSGAIAIVAVCLGIARAWWGVGAPTSLRSIAMFAAETVVTVTTVFWIEVVIYGVATAPRRNRRRDGLTG